MWRETRYTCSLASGLYVRVYSWGPGQCTACGKQNGVFIGSVYKTGVHLVYTINISVHMCIHRPAAPSMCSMWVIIYLESALSLGWWLPFCRLSIFRQCSAATWGLNGKTKADIGDGTWWLWWAGLLEAAWDWCMMLLTIIPVSSTGDPQKILYSTRLVLTIAGMFNMRRRTHNVIGWPNTNKASATARINLAWWCWSYITRLLHAC